MAKIVLRLNLRESKALSSALEYCDNAFGLGVMQNEIWCKLNDAIEIEEVQREIAEENKRKNG